eukprot:TRINITY_DN12149_c0_g1_i2.p1 TRINITY_DN12149_c0_g1~~TRINITY_DN12149_c0_g1_i2.p1  ORF type:complete len:402 (-),score=94.37 TRINITY_DN12149_c0_g1_i2:1133-2239(-)
MGEIERVLEEKFAKELKSDENSNQGGTSQFFVCKNLFCDGAYCLRCESFLKKEDMQHHFCKLSEVDKLYLKILDTLAESSTMKCPSCGAAGKKDLACTHITCDKCSRKFCYMCGVAEANLIGGFEVHNQWTLDTPPDEKRCPMYVQYKYGDVANGDQMDGDPAVALENFHLELQRKALEDLKKEVNNNSLWSRVEREKFNGSILPKPYVAPFKIRFKQRAQNIFKYWVVLSGISYFLLWAAMYGYFVEQAIEVFSETCDESIAKFLLIHASMGCYAYLTLFVSILLRKCGRSVAADRVLLSGASIFFSMLGTFIWGCIIFYRSSSCSDSVYDMGLLYFNLVWVSTGYLVFSICCWIGMIGYFGLRPPF